MKSRTTVISVSFNSSKIIEQMVNSIPEDIPIKVVDNGSSDDISERLHTYKNCELILNYTNQGFGRACNHGASQSQTEFLFFLNPDTIVNPDTILELEKFADTNPKMGAANPMIINKNNESRLKTSSIIPMKKIQKPELKKLSEMPVLSGSALFVRRSMFKKIGGFDPNIFLYHEDHELCKRLSQQGFFLWHVPTAVAVHIGGSSSVRSSKLSEWKGYHMARSRYYVLNKFYPGQAFQKTFWPAILGILNPINLFSSHRFFKYKGQIKGAVSSRLDGGIFKLHGKD